jgi:hypothetical protein
LNKKSEQKLFEKGKIRKEFFEENFLNNLRKKLNRNFLNDHNKEQSFEKS